MLKSPPINGSQQIGFFLAPKFSMLSFTACVEPLRSANRMSGNKLYTWELFSADGKPVQSSSGISLMADRSIDEVKHYPVIIVSAGLDPHLYNDPKVFSWLRHLDRHGTQIGGTSAGAYILARAGLLSGYKCTIHWEYLTGFVEEFPNVKVTTRLYEIDGDRFTSAGSGATFDMLLYLIGRQHGYKLSIAIAEQFSHFGANSLDSPQRRPIQQRLRINHPKLIAIIEQMEANLEEPMPRQKLARSVKLSMRQIERLFARYLGITPANYYIELRLERARQLLKQTSMPILEVSIACGFISASHFSKCYRKHFDHSPRDERP